MAAAQHLTRARFDGDSPALPEAELHRIQIQRESARIRLNRRLMALI